MGKSLGSINGFCRLRFIHLNPAAGVKRMGGGRGVSENSFVTTENSAPPPPVRGTKTASNNTTG